MYILSGFFPKFMAHIRQTLNSQKGSPPYVSPYTENSSETHLSAYSDSWSSPLIKCHVEWHCNMKMERKFNYP